MQQLGEYVLSLTAGAVICSILLSLLQEGTGQQLLRIVCGVYLSVTALLPLTGWSLPELEGILRDHVPEAEAAATMGEDMAFQQRQVLIKQELEAYLLDKAAGMDAKITPEVFLDETGTPVSIRISGAVSAPVQAALETVISQELGIAKEDQKWTG